MRVIFAMYGVYCRFPKRQFLGVGGSESMSERVNEMFPRL